MSGDRSDLLPVYLRTVTELPKHLNAEEYDARANSGGER
jgi:hypothetical protein